MKCHTHVNTRSLFHLKVHGSDIVDPHRTSLLQYLFHDFCRRRQADIVQYAVMFLREFRHQRRRNHGLMRDMGMKINDHLLSPLKE